MNHKQQNVPLHILLADDDKDDRFFFEKALKEITIATRLTSVNDGEQLMDYLSENSEHLPDVLFLDLSMPRKTGFECLAEIKEDIKLQELTVVMFSTSYPADKNYEQGIINMLQKVGAHHFIRKPNDFEQLKKIIHDSLTRAIQKNPVNG